MKQDDPKQALVPGFALFFKDCQRDKARLEGERKAKPLPLFDRRPEQALQWEVLRRRYTLGGPNE